MFGSGSAFPSLCWARGALLCVAGLVAAPPPPPNTPPHRPIALCGAGLICWWSTTLPRHYACASPQHRCRSQGFILRGSSAGGFCLGIRGSLLEAPPVQALVALALRVPLACPQLQNASAGCSPVMVCAHIRRSAVHAHIWPRNICIGGATEEMTCYLGWPSELLGTST